MVNCNYFQTYLSDFVEGSLPPSIQNEMHEHMLSCPYCFYMYGNVRQVCSMLKNLEQVHTSSTFESRLKERLIREVNEKSKSFTQIISSKKIMNGKTLAGAGVALLLIAVLSAMDQGRENSNTKFLQVPAAQEKIKSGGFNVSSNPDFSITGNKNQSKENSNDGQFVQRSDTTKKDYTDKRKKYDGNIEYINN